MSRNLSVAEINVTDCKIIEAETRVNPDQETGSLTELDFDIETLIALRLKHLRRSRKISRLKIAELLKITTQTVGRYERREHSMTIGTMIKFCEILKFSPLDLLVDTAPHIWGSTEHEASVNRDIMRMICEAPIHKREELRELMSHMFNRQISKHNTMRTA
jgi:transcriptional regulator with XRE-family HTH domain